jgi:hypothetical protein
VTSPLPRRLYLYRRSRLVSFSALGSSETRGFRPTPCGHELSQRYVPTSRSRARRRFLGDGACTCRGHHRVERAGPCAGRRSRTLAMVQVAMFDPHRLQCAETWASNQGVSATADLPGLRVWVHSTPDGDVPSTPSSEETRTARVRRCAGRSPLQDLVEIADRFIRNRPRRARSRLRTDVWLRSGQGVNEEFFAAGKPCFGCD